MHKCFISQEKIHECWHTFKDLFLIAADKHAPIVIRRVRGYSVPFQLATSNDLCMNVIQYHHKKALSRNKELHWSNYKRLRNTINARIRKEKSTYHSNQLAEEKDSKAMWPSLNSTRRAVIYMFERVIKKI